MSPTRPKTQSAMYPQSCPKIMRLGSTFHRFCTQKLKFSIKHLITAREVSVFENLRQEQMICAGLYVASYIRYTYVTDGMCRAIRCLLHTLHIRDR